MNTKIKEHDRDVKQCSNCNTFGAKLVCRNCKAARYCSKECQTEHWKKGHKRTCTTLEETIRETKKKDTVPGSKECANCDASGAKLLCAKCKATNYCSKACQLSHWKNGHKEMCFTPEERRPASIPIAETSPPVPLCVICHENLSLHLTVELPCKHTFHTRCVLAMRKFARNQNCPVCRAELPRLAHEDAMRCYAIIDRRLELEGCDWTALSKDEMVESKKMLVLLRGAATEGFSHAQCTVGLMLLHGQGLVATNVAEAAKWIQKAAEQGVPGAQYIMGNILEAGTGVKENRVEAATWFQKAAKQGYMHAQSHFGYLLLTGEVIPQNRDEAVSWLRKAAAQGDAEAQCMLGVELMKSVADHRNEFEAVMWFRKAAEQEHRAAQFNLGLSLMTGNGVMKCLAESVKWYRMAAEKGYLSAQVNLGVALMTGKGVDKSEAEAIKWYHKAAVQGSVHAQSKLGEIYRLGQGVGANQIESVKWYRKAAEQNDRDSQLYYGLALEKGLGIAEDKVEAAYWIKRSGAERIRLEDLPVWQTRQEF